MGSGRAEGNQRVVKSVHAAKDTASNIAAMLKSRALAELATRFAELATNCASLQREVFLAKIAKPFFDAMGPGRCNAALQNLVSLLSGDYTFEALLVYVSKYWASLKALQHLIPKVHLLQRVLVFLTGLKSVVDL